MLNNSHSTSSRKRKARSPEVYPPGQPPPQYALSLSLPNLAGPSFSNLPVLPEPAEVGAQGPKARQAALPAVRPSQNRAAFGRWKSKAIPGFPAANVPLPAGITAQEVLESFPNHIDDHVILDLMREGRGAKAIDALIPAPPGKQKAGQSHSKIQLRISTIREAFPNESFPITSTKRQGARGEVPRDDEMTSEDEAARTQRAVSNPNQTGEQLALSIEGRGPATSFTPNLTQATRQPQQAQPLDEQIWEEHEKHKDLIFDIYYCNQPLSRPETKQTIHAHCEENYDALSRELHARLGATWEKAILPDGSTENSLSYLRRSIFQCFERLPDFRARIDSDCPADQIHQQLMTAVLQDLLGRLRYSTRYLEGMLETRSKIRAHVTLHARHSAQVENTLTTGQGTKVEMSSSVPGSRTKPQTFTGLTSVNSVDPKDIEVPSRVSKDFPIPVTKDLPSQQPAQDAGNVRTHVDSSKSDLVSEPVDHGMTDPPQTNPDNPRHEFDAYMSGAGEFVNHEAKATDLHPTTGKHHSQPLSSNDSHQGRIPFFHKQSHACSLKWSSLMAMAPSFHPTLHLLVPPHPPPLP